MGQEMTKKDSSNQVTQVNDISLLENKEGNKKAINEANLRMSRQVLKNFNDHEERMNINLMRAIAIFYVVLAVLSVYIIAFTNKYFSVDSLPHTEGGEDYLQVSIFSFKFHQVLPTNEKFEIKYYFACVDSSTSCKQCDFSDFLPEFIEHVDVTCSVLFDFKIAGFIVNILI